jgi:hypothetical protein
MMAIFRAPPEDPSHSYQPFVSSESAELIHSHKIPAIKAILEELVALGE